MTARIKIQQVRDLTSEISAIIPRVRVVVTDPRARHKDRVQLHDTPIVTLMEMEPKSAFNRAYIVTARDHAVRVMRKREKGVDPEQAQQAWALRLCGCGYHGLTRLTQAAWGWRMCR